MNDVIDYPFLKAGTKFNKLFSEGTAFRLACTVSGMALFMLLRTIFSAFGGVRLDEFQALYYMAGNDDMTSGIINLSFGGLAAAVLGFMGASLFGMYAAAKNKDMKKAEKNLRYAKIAAVTLLIFTIFAVVFSFSSVGTIEYYYRTISKLYRGIQSNADDLFQKTVFIGTTALITEIVTIKLLWDIGHVIKGEPEGQKIHIFEMVIITVFSMEAAAIAVDNVINIFRFDYSAAGQNPAKLAMLIITFLMMLSVYLTIVFFLEMIFLHIFVYDFDDEYDEFFEPHDEFFLEPEEEFENRVFGKEPLPYGSTEDYQLTFEIPHTEYPESEAVNDG